MSDHPAEANSYQQIVATTGADANHFAHVVMLIASIKCNAPGLELLVCDYGFTAEQVKMLRAIEGVHYAAPVKKLFHPWEGKSLLGKFLRQYGRPWEACMWLDADALVIHPFPDIMERLEGYDLLIDAHVMSIGAVMHECNREVLKLPRDDAYFAAGFWIARKGRILESFERYTASVLGKGNLWEGDAFVAAIYHEKLRVRTVCGGIWHCRGKTSLHTCEVKGLTAYHEGQPIYVLHANDGYTVRADGRRIFKRPELAAIQEYYEKIFWEKFRRQGAGEVRSWKGEGGSTQAISGRSLTVAAPSIGES